MKKYNRKDIDQEPKKSKKPKFDKFDPARKNKKYHEKIIYSEKTLDF